MLRRDKQLDVTGVTGCYAFVLHILNLNLLLTFTEYKMSGAKTNVFVNFSFFFPPAHSCPVGQIYINCSSPQVDPELSRERTCENQLLNLTFSAHLPCVSGCVCPLG